MGAHDLLHGLFVFVCVCVCVCVLCCVRLEVYASDSGIGPISNGKLGKSNFLEIGCLYAINQSKS